ncbi:hypothetical protein [Shumkonia mesophila]|uniref:hypothetical protein n=1 Tax=Shumkonia mesophila TaxID=2838854 RepID=UPI00293428ED|nr:hypothetical protein [Shumkonia mesophila]
MRNADRQRSAFMSFVNVWMAFNGWMESVTQANTDAAMITALATNERLIKAYDALMYQSGSFRNRVHSFAAMWPVLNVRDVRKKLGHDVFSKLSMDELLAECVRHRVKFQPQDWENNHPPSWEQLLWTIYLVRCNMFHGVKSPQNQRDRELILHSDRILRIFIQDAGCFEWRD